VAFEDAAVRALEVVSALLTAAEEGRAQILDMRERIVANTTRFELDFTVLRERARTFLEQASGQEHQLVALKAETARAVETLEERLENLEQQATEDAAATQSEMDDLAEETDEEGERIEGSLQAAEAAANVLTASLREVEADLAAAVGEAEDLLRGVLAAEMRAIEQEVEHEAIELSAYFTGQCIPAIEQKAYDLYTFLRQAEEDVRMALETALEANETAADSVLREVADSYDDTLGDVDRLGSALEELMIELREFVDDGRQRVEDRKRRWDEATRRGRDGLREALESLTEVERFLARFSFGR
jgi:hypothetical protein